MTADLADKHALMQQLVLDAAHAACISLDQDLVVTAIAGEGDRYGCDDRLVGSSAVEALPFLHGLSGRDALSLPLVRVGGGRTVNVELIPNPDGCDIVMTDATALAEQARQLQQQGNEAALAHEALQKLSAMLDAARAEAEEAGLQKGRFIARMSHEFRTPLTAILSTTARLAAASELPPAARDGIATVARAARHLLNLVDNLLDQAQIEAGEIAVNPVPASPTEILEELSDLFVPVASELALDFTIIIDDALPELVELDDMRLRQVLINVIGNACKYTSEGGVEVRAGYADGMLVLRVRDSGAGMAPETIDLLFQPFQRGDVDRQPGAGLGLGISRHLVHLMGGTLELESEAGVGTVVTISLPAAAVADTRAASTRTGRGCVLLVEDDPDVAAALALFLRDAGYEVQEAASGGEAVAAARASAPDVVIMDRSLPDIDGCDAVRRIRADRFEGPVLMLTASNRGSDRDAALAAGCDEFLVKPPRVPQLLAAIERLVQAHAL
ncbi:MAG: response regulator [Gammaproteobacteria bacterium]|nr:response regulator [Gammaproteobacteria bacterium]